MAAAACKSPARQSPVPREPDYWSLGTRVSANGKSIWGGGESSKRLSVPGEVSESQSVRVLECQSVRESQSLRVPESQSLRSSEYQSLRVSANSREVEMQGKESPKNVKKRVGGPTPKLGGKAIELA